MISSALIVLPIALLLGACMGSFLNVCIWRIPRRCMSIQEPRGSVCPSCRTPIAWYHNLPVLSWILLRGACASCGSRIRFRYPAVEILTALLFALAAYLRLVVPVPEVSLAPNAPPPFPFTTYAQLAFDCFLLSGVVVLSFVDLDLHIIPDEISYPTIPLGLLAGALAPTAQLLHNAPLATGATWLDGLIAAAVGMVAGAGLLYALRLSWWILRRQEAMGMGDIKIMAGFGAFVGWDGSLLAIFLAALIASLIAGVRFFFTRKHQLAFGPYLALGAVILRLLDMRLYEQGVPAFERMTSPENFQTTMLGVMVLMGGLLVVLVVLQRDKRKMAEELEALAGDDAKT